MIGLKNIQHIFKNKNGNWFSSRVSQKKDLLNASRDWEIIFSVFIAFILVSALFSVYLFLQINKGEIFTVRQNGNVSLDTINRTLLEDTLLFFENKQQRFIEMNKNKPRFVDPSL